MKRIRRFLEDRRKKESSVVSETSESTIPTAHPVAQTQPKQTPAEFKDLRRLVEESVKNICELTPLDKRDQVQQELTTLLNSTSDSGLWQIAADIFTRQMHLTYGTQTHNSSTMYGKPLTPKTDIVDPECPVDVQYKSPLMRSS